MNFIQKQKQILKSYVTVKQTMVIFVGITLWQIGVGHYVEVIVLMCALLHLYLVKERYKRHLIEVDE